MFNFRDQKRSFQRIYFNGTVKWGPFKTLKMSFFSEKA